MQSIAPPRLASGELDHSVAELSLCPGCHQMTLKLHAENGAGVVSCVGSGLKYDPGMGYAECEWSMSWYRYALFYWAPIKRAFEEHRERQLPRANRTNPKAAGLHTDEDANAETARTSEVQQQARKVDKTRRSSQGAGHSLAARRQETARVIARATGKVGQFTVDGHTIHLDKEAASAILRGLNIEEDDAGEYRAILRRRALESRPNDVLLGSAVPSQPNRWKPEVEPSSRRDLCDICQQPEQNKRLAIDHNHATGKLRGFLCQRCNMAIGMLRDNPSLMRRAATYVTNPPGITFARYDPASTIPTVLGG